jgi:hypothetical protein
MHFSTSKKCSALKDLLGEIDNLNRFESLNFFNLSQQWKNQNLKLKKRPLRYWQQIIPVGNSVNTE